jgi:hypothetical protein
MGYWFLLGMEALTLKEKPHTSCSNATWESQYCIVIRYIVVGSSSPFASHDCLDITITWLWLGRISELG